VQIDETLEHYREYGILDQEEMVFQAKMKSHLKQSWHWAASSRLVVR